MARLLLAAALLATSLGCTEPPSADGGPVQVAATVAPHAWLVERVAGVDFHVITVLPATADPHSHTPTDAEVSRLARSRVLFRAGVPFENGSWLRAIAARGALLVDLRQGVDQLEDTHDHADDHGGHGTDPHSWTSPRRLAVQAQLIAAALSELRPERAEAIENRAREVQRELTDLDAELTARLAANAGRKFFVHHPSWSYFAADYGLVQVTLESEGSEPTDADVTRWLGLAREGAARVVFTQPQSADRSPRAVAEALDARVETLDPLASDVPGQLRLTAERLLASWDEP